MGILVTTKDVASELGVSETRIRQLLLGGRLKGRKFGNEWRIHPKDIEAVRHRTPGRPRKKQ